MSALNPAKRTGRFELPDEEDESGQIHKPSDMVSEAPSCHKIDQDLKGPRPNL